MPDFTKRDKIFAPIRDRHRMRAAARATGGPAAPRDPSTGVSNGHDAGGAGSLTVVSWNLLHVAGANADDVFRLLDRWQPDLLLMQEATSDIDRLPSLAGGFYARAPLPGRRHGVACWSRLAFTAAPTTLPLPAGALIRRVCQLVALPGLSLANVHLSHGQWLNRRQLRIIAAALPPCAAVLGDFNLVGPTLLPGFRDVGPRDATHRMIDLVPLRIDRCLARGLTCENAVRLPLAGSDHHPIMVRLRAMRP